MQRIYHITNTDLLVVLQQSVSDMSQIFYMWKTPFEIAPKITIIVVSPHLCFLYLCHFIFIFLFLATSLTLTESFCFLVPFPY